MIKEYLNQSVVWGDSGTPNKYNESTYTNKTIKARKEATNKIVMDKLGQETVVSAKIWTLEAVSVDDLIDGRSIIAVSPQIGLDGNVEFYEVYVI